MLAEYTYPVSHIGMKYKRSLVLERIILIVVLASVLMPTKNIFVLQASGLLLFGIVIVASGRIERSFLLFSLTLFVSLLALNVASGLVSFDVLKPVFGLSAVAVAISVEPRLSPKFYEAFAIIMFAVFATFYVLHLLDFQVITNIFRVTDQRFTIHLTRLTAPFLFAGDYGVACLFLAALCFQFERRLMHGLGLLFLVLLLFTQSRLALAGLPFLFLLVNGLRYKLIFFLVSSLVFVLAGFYLDRLIDLFPYVFRFFDDVDHYIWDSKRAQEYFYVYDNFPDLIFSGTDKFSVAKGLATAESSLVSYVVKTGMLVTTVFWAGVIYVMSTCLRYGLVMSSMLLFFATFAAPLDRPKLAIVVVIAVAGISCIRKNSSYYEISAQKA